MGVLCVCVLGVGVGDNVLNVGSPKKTPLLVLFLLPFPPLPTFHTPKKGILLTVTTCWFMEEPKTITGTTKSTTAT